MHVAGIHRDQNCLFVLLYVTVKNEIQNEKIYFIYFCLETFIWLSLVYKFALIIISQTRDQSNGLSLVKMSDSTVNLYFQKVRG